MGCMVGQGVIVCTGKGRRRKCSWCARPHTKLCDHPIPLTPTRAAGTCDAPMCDDHAKRIGPDADLCPIHAKSA